MGYSSFPSCGSPLVFMGCSGCSCSVLCFCCAWVTKAPRGVPSEPSVLPAMSRDRFPFGEVCRSVERRGVALQAGHVLSKRVLCMYSIGSTECKHTQQSRARSTRQFGGSVQRSDAPEGYVGMGQALPPCGVESALYALPQARSWQREPGSLFGCF